MIYKRSKIITHCDLVSVCEGREVGSSRTSLRYNTRPLPSSGGKADASWRWRYYAKANSFAEKYGEATDFAVMVSRFLRRLSLQHRASYTCLHCLGLASPKKIEYIKRSTLVTEIFLLENSSVSRRRAQLSAQRTCFTCIVLYSLGKPSDFSRFYQSRVLSLVPLASAAYRTSSCRGQLRCAS